MEQQATAGLRLTKEEANVMAELSEGSLVGPAIRPCSRDIGLAS